MSHFARDKTGVLKETALKTMDEHTMEAHGITCATRNVYFYKDYKYDRLEDAVRYSEIDNARVAKDDGKA